MPLRSPDSQVGFSLIELTVATAIYSMGLGSLSLMMMFAVHGTADAGHETSATFQTASLAELILMNPAAVGHYISDAGDPPLDCGYGTVCAPDEMASWILQAWRSQLQRALPAGGGLVCLDGSPDDGGPGDTACDGTGGPVIKVLWATPDAEGDPASGIGRHVARLPVP